MVVPLGISWCLNQHSKQDKCHQNRPGTAKQLIHCKNTPIYAYENVLATTRSGLPTYKIPQAKSRTVMRTIRPCIL